MPRDNPLRISLCDSRRISALLTDFTPPDRPTVNCNCFTARAVCGVATVLGVTALPLPLGVLRNVAGVFGTTGVRPLGVCGGGGRRGGRCVSAAGLFEASAPASCLNYYQSEFGRVGIRRSRELAWGVRRLFRRDCCGG